MDAWRVRLQQEHDDLVLKCGSLALFQKTDVYNSLPGRHQALLNLQRFIMLFYLDVLGRRLSDLEETDNG